MGTITYRILSEDEEKTVEQFAVNNNMHVRLFPRYGLSGGKLLLVSFDAEGVSRPFIIKLNSETKIREEACACTALGAIHAFDMDRPGGEAMYSHGVGGILYRHMGTYSPADADRVQDLKDYAFGRSPAAATRVKTCLTNLYQRVLTEAHCQAKPRQTALWQEYATEQPRPPKHDYLRLNDRLDNLGVLVRPGTRHLLTQALGDSAKADTVELFGLGKMYSPMKMLDRLLATDLVLHMGPIHGDLHASNVVLENDQDAAHLVDFAWGDADGHVMKDFALMENSLRFMAFPKCRVHDESMDLRLIEEDGWEKIVAEMGGRSGAAAYVGQVATLVGVVRSAARQCAKRGASFPWYTEYMLSQFLLLVGCLAHPEYSFRDSIRCLCLIADRLHKEGVAAS